MPSLRSRCGPKKTMPRGSIKSVGAFKQCASNGNAPISMKSGDVVKQAKNKRKDS